MEARKGTNASVRLGSMERARGSVVWLPEGSCLRVNMDFETDPAQSQDEKKASKRHLLILFGRLFSLPTYLPSISTITRKKLSHETKSPIMHTASPLLDVCSPCSTSLPPTAEHKIPRKTTTDNPWKLGGIPDRKVSSVLQPEGELGGPKLFRCPGRQSALHHSIRPRPPPSNPVVPSHPVRSTPHRPWVATQSQIMPPKLDFGTPKTR